MARDYKTLKKSGFIPQKQKDYFALRIRVVGGHLTTEQLMVITKAAQKYGAGHVHLTSRQSVEIPFVHADDIDQIKADLAVGGVEPSVCGPGVRTVTACQGNAICASGCAPTLELARELDSRYYGRELPHKFKIGITGCLNNCLKAEENDLGFKGAMKVKWIPQKCVFCGACKRACRSNAIKITDKQLSVDYRKCKSCGRCAKSCPTKAWDTKSGYMLSFGGLFGNTISKGKNILPVITDHDTLLRVSDAAIDFFETHANPSERFKFAIDRIDWDIFEKIIKDANHGESAKV